MSESRNKREGGYLGKYRCIHDKHQDCPRRHHRRGKTKWWQLKDKGQKS